MASRKPTPPIGDHLLHVAEAARRLKVDPSGFMRHYVPRFRTLSEGVVIHRPREGGRKRFKFPASVIVAHIHDDLGTGNCTADVPESDRLDFVTSQRPGGVS